MAVVAYSTVSFLIVQFLPPAMLKPQLTVILKLSWEKPQNPHRVTVINIACVKFPRQFPILKTTTNTNCDILNQKNYS
ncbi:hypothetical protein C813_21215 [Kosakonia sacchari SP1]|nr:hypothetical protein C813_21215 [Kosakonia sacchari SP1]